VCVCVLSITRRISNYMSINIICIWYKCVYINKLACIYIYLSLFLKWSDSADFWIIYGSTWVHHGLPHFPHFRPVWHFQCSQFRLPVIPNPMMPIYRQSDKHAQKNAALGTLGKRNVSLYVCFVPPQHAQSKSTRNGSGTGTLATHHLAPFGVTWLVGESRRLMVAGLYIMAMDQN
jgi:hypothetical protein